MRVRTIWITLLLLVAPLIVRAQSKPLPETYISEDERMTVRYPTGWVVKTGEEGLIQIATSEAMFELGGRSVPSGEAEVVVMFLDGYAALPDDMRDALAEGDPLSILNLWVKGTSQNYTHLGDGKSVLFAGHPAARTDGTVSDNPVFFILVDNGDRHYSIITAIAAVGEMLKFEPKLLAIAESVNYQPPLSSG